jgi:hypothetical protein
MEIPNRWASSSRLGWSQARNFAKPSSVNRHSFFIEGLLPIFNIAGCSRDYLPISETQWKVLSMNPAI